MSVVGGRFVEPDITAGVTPRVEVVSEVVSEEQPLRHAPRVAVKLLMGQLEGQMTVAQWQDFVKRVEKALQQEGLAR